MAYSDWTFFDDLRWSKHPLDRLTERAEDKKMECDFCDANLIATSVVRLSEDGEQFVIKYSCENGHDGNLEFVEVEPYKSYYTGKPKQHTGDYGYYG
jgi:hypothetical protein